MHGVSEKTLASLGRARCLFVPGEIDRLQIEIEVLPERSLGEEISSRVFQRNVFLSLIENLDVSGIFPAQDQVIVDQNPII